MTDASAALIKITKSSETRFVRSAALKALSSLIVGADDRIQDQHSDILKVASKCASDKSVDIRRNTALLILYVARNSSGAVSATIDALFTAVGKGLEDENAVVQDTYSR